MGGGGRPRSVEEGADTAVWLATDPESAAAASTGTASRSPGSARVGRVAAMCASTQELIKTAIERFQADVPALAQLKLVFELELRGRGDVQMFRVELPGPRSRKGSTEDARVTVSIPRSQFNELARGQRRGTTARPTRRARSRPTATRNPEADRAR